MMAPGLFIEKVNFGSPLAQMQAASACPEKNRKNRNRYSFTVRIQAGEHPKRMQRQLGHASIQVTLDVYGHLMEEVNQEAAERLQTLIFKVN